MENALSISETQEFCDNVVEKMIWTEHKRLWLLENKYLMNLKQSVIKFILVDVTK